MRRMLLPEVKIKSKLKDDTAIVSIEELLTHSYLNDPQDPSLKSVIIQTVAQIAGDKNDDDGGIYITDSDLLNTDITNATLTITQYTTQETNILYINGLGINIVINLSVTNIEDVDIQSIYGFDVYIIKP